MTVKSVIRIISALLFVILSFIFSFYLVTSSNLTAIFIGVILSVYAIFYICYVIWEKFSRTVDVIQILFVLGCGYYAFTSTTKYVWILFLGAAIFLIYRFFRDYVTIQED